MSLEWGWGTDRKHKETHGWCRENVIDKDIQMYFRASLGFTDKCSELERFFGGELRAKVQGSRLIHTQLLPFLWIERTVGAELAAEKARRLRAKQAEEKARKVASVSRLSNFDCNQCFLPIYWLKQLFIWFAPIFLKLLFRSV